MCTLIFSLFQQSLLTIICNKVLLILDFTSCPFSDDYIILNQLIFSALMTQDKVMSAGLIAENNR